MASITIRRLEDSVIVKLRLRAAANGQSMEEEARQILRSALDQLPTDSVHNMDNDFSSLSLEERLMELENQGIWIAAKDTDTRSHSVNLLLGRLNGFLLTGEHRRYI